MNIFLFVGLSDVCAILLLVPISLMSRSLVVKVSRLAMVKVYILVTSTEGIPTCPFSRTTVSLSVAKH